PFHLVRLARRNVFLRLDFFRRVQRALRAIQKGPKSKKNDENSSKKGSIVIEVVSPSPESGVATPSCSEEATNSESPITISAPFSPSGEGGTPPFSQMGPSIV
ncbi:hypothetical protein PoB_002804600, partial [Plakobranchus ocellatus]